MERKTKTKLTVAILLCATALGVGLALKKRAKLKKTREAQDKKIDEELENRNIKREVLEEKVGLNEDTIFSVKAVFAAMYFADRTKKPIDRDKVVPFDVVDFRQALKSEALIHVIEGSYNGKRTLDLLFELPEYCRCTKGMCGIDDNRKDYYPQFGDFKRAFDEMTEELVSHHIKTVSRVFSRMVCHAYISYIDRYTHEIIHKDLELSDEIFEPFVDDSGKGMKKFYEHYVRYGVSSDISSALENSELLVKETGDMHFSVDDIYLAWKISIPIQTKPNTGKDLRTYGNWGGYGINYYAAIDCLAYVTNPKNFSIRRSNKTFGGKIDEVISFENILFHAPKIGSDDETTTGDLMTYYEVRNGIVSVDEIDGISDTDDEKPEEEEEDVVE